jgi:hypothetical protein
MYLKDNIFKKIVPYFLATALSMSVATGCGNKETREELSDIIKQESIVFDKYHRPAKEVNYTFMKIGDTQSHPIRFTYSSEEHKIYFDGKVEFESEDKSIYDRFNKGDKVIVMYRERFKNTYKPLDDGSRELVKQKFKGYKLIDVVKK